MGAVTTREGEYHGSRSRYSYLNGADYDREGRLHLTWCWRESWDPMTNHDLCYVYSDDHGRTWFDTAGKWVGETGKTVIRFDSPDVTVWEIGRNRGLINTTCQAVDGRRRVHVVTWHVPPDGPQAKSWDDARRRRRYYHYWRDESGGWNRQPLPFFGRKPRLVVNESGGALMVFNKGPDLEYHGREHGGRLHVAAATAKARWTDWRVVYTSDRDFVGEPRVDLLRWRAECLLSIYVQEKPDQPGNPSPLRLIEFEPHSGTSNRR